MLALSLSASAALGEDKGAVLRGLAAGIGRVLGAAWACPNIARPRIGAITNTVVALIKSSAANPDEASTIFAVLNNSQAEGSRSISAKVTDCKATELQLAGLERISSPPALESPPAQESSSAQELAAARQSPAAPAGAIAFAGQAAASALRGVDSDEVDFGILGPFSGADRDLGQQMRIGIETAFAAVNDEGGVNGRMLRLAVADDGDDPTRTAEAIKELYESERIFGFVGNVGTSTAMVSAPFALEHRMLFFGAFTGTDILRREPPDRYVFNYRASYAEETAAAVNYLVNVRKLRPDQIAVFAEQDAFGDSGFAGVLSAMRTIRGGDGGYVLRVGYPRNTTGVDAAIVQLKAHKVPIKGIVMVATYRAAAKFIEKTHDAYPGLIYTSGSYVGSTSLKDELMLLGPQYAAGVVVTQAVPALDGYSTLVLQYKSALARYFSSESPDYVSFEGYVVAQVLIEAIRRTGPELNTEKLVDAFESMHGFDLGLGAEISFGKNEHQGLHKVWGTQLNESGKYDPIDLQ